MNKLLQISLTMGMTLAVQSALTISSQAEIQTEPNLVKSKTENSKVEEFTFDFNNTFDYAACLDVILLAHEKRVAELENVFKNDCATNVLNTYGNNLSQDVAFQLVKSADFYVMEELEDPLYPTLGLRRRIAINLGYVYDIDKSNPDILKYINSASE